MPKVKHQHQCYSERSHVKHPLTNTNHTMDALLRLNLKVPHLTEHFRYMCYCRKWMTKNNEPVIVLLMDGIKARINYSFFCWWPKDPWGIHGPHFKSHWFTIPTIQLQSSDKLLTFVWFQTPDFCSRWALLSGAWSEVHDAGACRAGPHCYWNSIWGTESMSGGPAVTALSQSSVLSSSPFECIWANVFDIQLGRRITATRPRRCKTVALITVVSINYLTLSMPSAAETISLFLH